MRIGQLQTALDSQYEAPLVMGDALAEGGISDVTRKGTFQYPETVNMRRVTGISAISITAIPFRLASNQSLKANTKHVSRPNKWRY